MSATEFGSARFLITIALADGDVVRVPAADHAELDHLLGRMSGTCEAAGVPTPETVVWRLDRGEQRPLSAAELEEGDLRRHSVFAG